MDKTILGGIADALATGWSYSATGASAREIAAAIKQIGSPHRSRDGRPGIERLEPKARAHARSPSLSRCHGRGASLLHN